ncbi:MAG TPA: baseplate J/gp47 family protein, partial [Candidatus Nitrosocosmicus sp.]|nr:baseplate J/gp47 family protein [Candidatus Nitrosocosmicus sp.]
HIVGLKNDINNTGKKNLLRYASGSVLDAIGERSNTTRIAATKSNVTMRYTLSTAQPGDITIPQGSRVTPDGAKYFATTKALVIAAGQLYGDVEAQATVAGAAYNGLIAGQISKIVDLVPFVASVVNTSTSSGGSDIESDDAYRLRIQEAPAKFSTAGPEAAYIFWAKTASAEIEDVAITSPGDGQIRVVVLMKNGQLPSQEVLDKVLASCSDKKRRPLTDKVTSAAPTTVPYNIALTYYISNERSTEETIIRTAIEGVNGALEQYKSWQGTKLGRPINPDYLRQLMLNAGASRITLTAPAYTSVDIDKVAAVSTTTITYGGLE